MKINKDWHEKHRMSKNPSLEERIDWHIEHAKHCACRPIPKSLIAKIVSRNKTKNDTR
ncbi:MAG: hypothetical protein Kow0090_19580 [Myxococcota bacterium]